MSCAPAAAAARTASNATASFEARLLVQGGNCSAVTVNLLGALIRITDNERQMRRVALRFQVLDQGSFANHIDKLESSADTQYGDAPILGLLKGGYLKIISYLIIIFRCAPVIQRITSIVLRMDIPPSGQYQGITMIQFNEVCLGMRKRSDFNTPIFLKPIQIILLLYWIFSPRQRYFQYQ